MQYAGFSVNISPMVSSIICWSVKYPTRLLNLNWSVKIVQNCNSFVHPGEIQRIAEMLMIIQKSHGSENVPHHPFHFCLGKSVPVAPAECIPRAASRSQRLRPAAGITSAFLHSCYHWQSSLYWALLVTGLAVSGMSRSSHHQEHVIFCIFHINVQDKEQTLRA